MDPIHLLRREGQVFLLLLVVLLVYRLLTRQINLSRLLARKDGSGGVSPERVQLLVATVAMSAKVLGDALHSSDGTMPALSAQSLYMFGASGGIYSVVKVLRTMWAGKA